MYSVCAKYANGFCIIGGRMENNRRIALTKKIDCKLIKNQNLIPN